MAYNPSWNTNANVNPTFGQGPPTFGGGPAGYPPGPTSVSSFQSSFPTNPSTFPQNYPGQNKPFGNTAPSFSQSVAPFTNPQPGNWGNPASFQPGNPPTQYNPGFPAANPSFPPPLFGNPQPTNFAAPNTGFSSGPNTFMNNPANPSPNTFANPSFTTGNSFGNPPNFGNTSGFLSANPNNFAGNPTGFNYPGFTNSGSFTSPPNSIGNNPGFNNPGMFAGNNGFGSNNSNFVGALKYKPTQVREETGNLTVLNIGAMQEIMGKSIEEQRLQDYKQKGSSSFNMPNSAPMSSGLNPAGSLFNPMNQTLGANNTSSMFKPPEIKPAGSLFNPGGSLFPSSNSQMFPSTSTPSLFTMTSNPMGANPNNNSLAPPSLFNNSASLFPTTPSLSMNNNTAPSLFTNNNSNPGSLFSTANTSNASMFAPKPQQNTFANPMQQPDYLKNAYKDPHGLSWLFPEVIPENVMKSYTQRVSTQISAESTSVVERIVKPKRISNYPQVLTEKWKNTQEKKYLKSSSSFDLISQKKNEPFFVAKRPNFVNLKLEEYKDEDNSKYFKMPGNTPKKVENTTEILVTAYDPNPIRMVFPVKQFTTIKEIKYQVSRHLPDLEISDFQLAFKSKILQDTDTIKTGGIFQNDELTVLKLSNSTSVNRDLPSDEMLPNVPAGYKTKPSLVDMARMSVEQLKKIQNFTVENQFGRLVFEGETNVIGLNIAEILRINHKEVVGYPDDSDIRKPEIGAGLNKPAVLTLFKYELSGTKEKAENRIKNMCKNANMEFQNYDAEAQLLQVRIRHF